MMRVKRIKHRRWAKPTAAATVALLAVAAPFGAGTAGAATVGSTPRVIQSGSPVVSEFVQSVGTQVIANQEALSVFRSWMMGQPGFADSGYVGSIDDLPHKATTVMWAGPHTALLASIIKEGKRRGITVSVQQRSHNLGQLNAAINKIWHDSATGDLAGFKVSAIAAVGATDDGLKVYGTYEGASPSNASAQPQSVATTVLGVPVSLVPGVGAITTTGRDNDYNPFFAGGYMASPGSNTGCSTAFAITVNGTSRITTARHCNQNDYRDRAAANLYGTGLQNSTDGGGRVLSAGGAPGAWDGAFNSDNFAKLVIGYEDLAVNDYVCTGGGNSGEHCNIRVTNLLVNFNDHFGAFNTIEGVQQTAGRIANMQGDSGGPVVSLTGTTSTQVRAAGMIQGLIGPGMQGAACGPAYDVAGNLCATNVLFSSMRTVVSHIAGAALLTG